MIPEPMKGQSVGAAWAAEVTRAANRCSSEIDAVKNTALPANRRASSDAHPWMVVGGTDDGDAKLTVYIPQGSLVVADEEIDPDDIDGVTAVDDAPGYYTVDGLDDLETSAEDAAPLFLAVWRAEEGEESETDPEAGAVKAAVTLDPESVEGKVLLKATVARVWASTPEGGGKTYGAVAEQIVRSAVHVGAGSEGAEDGGGGSGYYYTGTKDVPYAFDGPRSDGKLYAKTKTWTFQNGLLVSISTEDGDDILVAETVAHSEI